MSAAHPVAICDRRWRVVLRGRTSLISERELLCLTRSRRGLGVKGRVFVEITLPAGRSLKLRHSPNRTARYRGRIARVEEIGQFVALAIELTKRL